MRKHRGEMEMDFTPKKSHEKGHVCTCDYESYYKFNEDGDNGQCFIVQKIVQMCID